MTEVVDVTEDVFPSVEVILATGSTKCSECLRTFANSSACRMHMIKLHGIVRSCEDARMEIGRKAGEDPKKRRFHCADSICVRKERHFLTMAQLRQHYYKQHMPANLACAQCGKKFVLSRDLDYHMRKRCKTRGIASEYEKVVSRSSENCSQATVSGRAECDTVSASPTYSRSAEVLVSEEDQVVVMDKLSKKTGRSRKRANPFTIENSQGILDLASALPRGKALVMIANVEDVRLLLSGASRTAEVQTPGVNPIRPSTPKESFSTVNQAVPHQLSRVLSSTSTLPSVDGQGLCPSSVTSLSTSTATIPNQGEGYPLINRTISGGSDGYMSEEPSATSVQPGSLPACDVFMGSYAAERSQRGAGATSSYRQLSDSGTMTTPRRDVPISANHTSAHLDVGTMTTPRCGRVQGSTDQNHAETMTSQEMFAIHSGTMIELDDLEPTLTHASTMTMRNTNHAGTMTTPGYRTDQRGAMVPGNHFQCWEADSVGMSGNYYTRSDELEELGVERNEQASTMRCSGTMTTPTYEDLLAEPLEFQSTDSFMNTECVGNQMRQRQSTSTMTSMDVMFTDSPGSIYFQSSYRQDGESQTGDGVGIGQRPSAVDFSIQIGESVFGRAAAEVRHVETSMEDLDDFLRSIHTQTPTSCDLDDCLDE